MPLVCSAGFLSPSQDIFSDLTKLSRATANIIELFSQSSHLILVWKSADFPFEVWQRSTLWQQLRYSWQKHRSPFPSKNDKASALSRENLLLSLSNVTVNFKMVVLCLVSTWLCVRLPVNHKSNYSDSCGNLHDNAEKNEILQLISDGQYAMCATRNRHETN